MLIGEVARRSGVSARMLRHYDRLGLVRPTGRTGGGYREYSEEDIRRIFHVESLRSLGLSLGEVRRALDDPGFAPTALVGGLIEQTRRRMAAEEELLGRLRRVQATGPADWDDVLRIVSLLRALDSPRAVERHRAALSSTEPHPAAALTEALLAEAEPNVAGAIQWALARSGSEALSSLAAALQSARAGVRQRAVAALAAVAGDDATALLRGALDDPDDEVRARAALALGARGRVEAVPVLVAMVVAGRLDVEAAETLGTLATTAELADDVVRGLVGSAGHGDRQVRRRLAQALAELPGDAADQALSTLAHDDDPGVSLTARAVLGRDR